MWGCLLKLPWSPCWNMLGLCRQRGVLQHNPGEWKVVQATLISITLEPEKILGPKAICLMPGAFPWCSSHSSPCCLRADAGGAVSAQEKVAPWPSSGHSGCCDFACGRLRWLMGKSCLFVFMAWIKDDPHSFSFPIAPAAASGICPLLMFYVTWDQLYKRTRESESIIVGDSELGMRWFFLLHNNFFFPNSKLRYLCRCCADDIQEGPNTLLLSWTDYSKRIVVKINTSQFISFLLFFSSWRCYSVCKEWAGQWNKKMLLQMLFAELCLKCFVWIFKCQGSPTV